MNLLLRVPATTSNVGPGFDCFGMALSLHLEIEVRPAAALTVTAEGADVPLDRTNLVVKTCLDALGPAAPEPKLALHLRNRIPLRRGMGSSATAIVAGLALAEAIQFGPDGVDKERIARHASQLEGHPDNATPAALGGFCIGAGETFERVEMNDRAYLLVVPAVEIETEAARHALPRQLSLTDAVFNLQRAALAAVRIARTGDLSGAAPFEDRLHQRHRLGLDAGLARLFESLRQCPSVESLFLSGSGSTILLLPRNPDQAEGDARRLLQAEGLGQEVLTAQADNRGLVVEPR